MERRLMTGARRRLGAALLLGVAAVGCATNPVTGRRQLSLVSEAQEIELGRQSAVQVQQQIGLVQNEALQQYVQRVGATLAAESERPNLPWTFRVVDDPTPNAFALPGGFIFLTRGMMAAMDSEAELAAVLGHEIGHVTARHSVSQISRAQLAQLGLGLGAIFFPSAAQSLGGLAQGGLQLLFLRYGRDAERQADELGFRYALRESYEVREMDDVFATLQRIGEAEGRSGLPSWLASHPAEAERIQTARARADTVTRAGLRTGEAEYLRMIDGLVYGENPRAGYFQGGLFLHPDLRFQLRFPEGWQTQNLPQAVVAASPRQDAVIQLAFSEVQGAEAATRQFLGQQGIRPGQSSRQNFGGAPGVVSYFQAQTQQGVITGLAAFVDYGGRTYQILSYAGANAFAGYERLFGQVAASFAPLTDPAALGVRPNVVDVVRIDRRMTLAEFVRANPSVVPVAELAILNQVSGPEAVLQPGTLVKRVIRS